MRACFTGLFRALLAASILMLADPVPLRAGPMDDINTLTGQAFALHDRGKYREATERAERALSLAEKVRGPQHLDTLGLAHILAFFHEAAGHYPEAEQLYRRALAGFEKTRGADHVDTLRSANNLGQVYQAQGRYAEAEPLCRRALAGFEKKLGTQHPDTIKVVSSLGLLYYDQGRYAETEPLFKRALAGREKLLGAKHRDTLKSVHNLAGLYDQQSRYSEAEALYRRAMAGDEEVLGPEHPETLTTVNGLGMLYRKQGRTREAEALYRRVLAGREEVLGPEHPETLTSVNNLGFIYDDQGRYAEAEALYRRALAGREKVLGSEHPDTLMSVNNLAAHYQQRGRLADAEPLWMRLLAGSEKVLGPEHPDTLLHVGSLAGFYHEQGRHAEAEQYYRRALAGLEKAMGPDHPDTLGSLSNLAVLHFERRDWSGAAKLLRRGAKAIAERIQRGVQTVGQPLTGRKSSEADRPEFWALAKAGYRLGPEGHDPDVATSREMFEVSQWALNSEAAQSLTQMAARGAKGDSVLATLVRERQDLVGEWRVREQSQGVALGQETAKRNFQAEAANSGRMGGIDRRITAIDMELAVKFPGHAALASPAPLSVQEVQAQLGADEALVLFVITPKLEPTPQETFIWVVTKTDLRWTRADLGSTALTREVQALRCGLDHAAWKGARCKELTGSDYVQPLPFDHARAYRLYQALLGGVEDLIRDKKHLLLVPAGALTQLPFQVLITAPPASADHRAAAWLTRSHALTVLPAVSSLKALRATARPSAASKPMIGFGNPLLDGPDGRYSEYAKLARNGQSCAKTAWERLGSFLGLRDGATPVETRNGLAEVSTIRKLAPLPETADELCAVGRDVGAAVSDIRLGAKATERELKAMSETGELARYRIVHFATHGAMAGQLNATAEPGLILTPPNEASPQDDGYLSASEVAALKLDADWVILSACNTAAGNAESAEALSGLARAFFYAQARALLVSHWEVDSNATVKLITTAMREAVGDRTVGRAEALRRAELALIDRGEPLEAHPAYWAPFVVVGEGAR